MTPTREHPKRLIGYCRVSGDNQKEEGTIEIQRQALREYAERKEYVLVDIFCYEGISGGLQDRPGLSRLFDCLEADPSASSRIFLPSSQCPKLITDMVQGSTPGFASPKRWLQHKEATTSAYHR